MVNDFLSLPAGREAAGLIRGATRMADTFISSGTSSCFGLHGLKRVAAASGLVLAGLALAGCMTTGSTPTTTASIQPQAPVAPAASIAPYQVANAPVVQSDGMIVPVPRAKPFIAPQAGATAQPKITSANADLAGKAAAYRAFDAAIDDLANRKFKSPRDVRAALDTLRPHNTEFLAEGWIANSAYLAAAQPEFAAAVKSAVEREGKDAVLSKLKSGSGVWMFSGSQKARSAVVAEASVTYKKLTNLGQRFLTTAVEFQRTRWGKYEAPAPFSVAPQYAANDVAGSGFGNVLAELAGVTEAHAAVPVMQRILSIAGHIAIEEDERTSAAKLTSNRDLTRCTRFSRLNLNQCLAAAHFPSEEAYCTGKHAVNEIAYCWAEYLPDAAR